MTEAKMHLNEDNSIFAPWVGPMQCKAVLSVGVLSSNREIIERISEALRELHGKGNFRWKILILGSDDLEKLSQQPDMIRLGLDFVVLGMDTSEIFCIDWTKKILEQVHPDLRKRRVILVNASGLTPHGMAVSPSELINFFTEYKLDMLNANVYQNDEANHLARRLLKFIEVSIGIKTGLPNLNI